MYQFILIDPRNPAVPANTLGVEVTVPEIAAMCDLGNIDPQHGCNAFPPDPPSFVVWGDAAIASAVGWPLPAAPADPSKCVTLATIRPDLDAFGAMAVLALRAAGLPVKGEGHPAWDAQDSLTKRGAIARVLAVAAADGNAATEWAPRPLPTTGNPWPEGVEIGSRRNLAAIAAVCALHNTSVAYRVAIVAAWLLGGDTPTPEEVHTAAMAVLPSLSAAPFDVIDTLAECRARVEAERADMIAALHDGRIRITTIDYNDEDCDDYDADYHGEPARTPQIAIVRSAHRAATSLGQSVAPVAICFHPAFPWPQGHTTPKATIAWAVPPGVEAVTRGRDVLNHYESAAQWSAYVRSLPPGTMTHPGDWTASLWGGNLASGILGSPQGRASLLSEDEIVSLVRGAL